MGPAAALAWLPLPVRSGETGGGASERREMQQRSSTHGPPATDRQELPSRPESEDGVQGKGCTETNRQSARESVPPEPASSSH